MSERNNLISEYPVYWDWLRYQPGSVEHLRKEYFLPKGNFSLLSFIVKLQIVSNFKKTVNNNRTRNLIGYYCINGNIRSRFIFVPFALVVKRRFNMNVSTGANARRQGGTVKTCKCRRTRITRGENNHLYSIYSWKLFVKL